MQTEHGPEALAAVRQWRFTPATLDGRPIPLRIHIEMSFSTRQAQRRFVYLLPAVIIKCSGRPAGARDRHPHRVPIVQRPRTWPFQGQNTGSNPVGDANTSP